MRPPPRAASGGRVVVVWNRGDGELWQRSSSDGGVTWSTEMRIAGCCRRIPSVAAIGGVLWLAYENDGDIWYRTSANQGTTWSVEDSFHALCGTRWGRDAGGVGGRQAGLRLALHPQRQPGHLVWHPWRAEDDQSAALCRMDRASASCNPDSDDTITFRALARDETGVASVRPDVDVGWRRAGRSSDVRRRLARRR